MRNQFVYVFLLLLNAQNAIIAQYNYDRFWIPGSGPGVGTWTYQDSLFEYGGCLIDFNENKPVQSLFNMEAGWGFSSNTMISDAQGNLQFYVNSCSIWNYAGKIMSFGDSLNYPSGLWYNYCSFEATNVVGGLGYPAHDQGILILPFPNNDKKYEVFHLWADGKTGNSKALMHTTVDMSKNNGLGAVMSKNNMIFRDSLGDGISAVRHGNGRDWWIFTSVFGEDYAYLTRLTPKGVMQPKKTTTLGRWDGQDQKVTMIGQSTFSPDGNLFARIDVVLDDKGHNNGLQIAHFDRCAGEFFCPINIPWNFEVADSDDYPGSEISACGVAFSPNSRFLYVSTGYRLYQFDMWADDIPKSWVLVGKYDGFSGPLSATFYSLQLAINGKIYMNATNTLSYYHVIHEPNEKGLDCKFVNHGLKLLSVNQLSMPNFPHYRLFDAADSPCDTLGIDAPKGFAVTRWNRKLQILPNPTNEMAKVELPTCRNGRLAVYSVLGQRLFELENVDDKDAIYLDTIQWAAGTYFVTLFIDGARPLTTKMIIVH